LIKSQGLIISKGEKFRKFPDLLPLKILEVAKRKRRRKKRWDLGWTLLRIRPDSDLYHQLWTKTCRGQKHSKPKAAIDSGRNDAGEFRLINKKGGIRNE